MANVAMLHVLALVAAGCAAPSSAAPGCDGGSRLRVHFYDVGQGLAALVDLPDGRHILVDSGDDAERIGCGAPCREAARYLIERLREDLAGDPIALLWITHPHSDHVGGATAVLQALPVEHFVDNGTASSRPLVIVARAAALRAGATWTVVDPLHAGVPLAAAAPVHIEALLPPRWPVDCESAPNDCSIGLRIDFCASSVVFPGDAELGEESLLEIDGPVSLLQISHHGSDDASSAEFLARASPRHAVISAGIPGQGINRVHCHPRSAAVDRLNTALGGPTKGVIAAFDSASRCSGATDEGWLTLPAVAGLWSTQGLGDVIVETSGDGVFTRLQSRDR